MSSGEQNPWSGTIEWVKTLILNAFAQGTPREGMEASAILFAVTFASNFIGLVFTIILDILFAVLFFVNMSRYIHQWLTE